MNKKIILLLLIFLLTGCYDKHELNDIAIISATEIDKIEDNYIITAEIINPESPDKTTNIASPFIIYEGIGKTLDEAYRQINSKSSRYLYADHIQIMIINENIAKEDIKEILDFYLRKPTVRTEFKVLIGKNKNILSVTTPINKISSSSILNSLISDNKYLGISNLVTFNDMTDMILNPNKELILPSIKLDNENETTDKLENIEKAKPNSKYILDNLAIFKDNKLLGYLTKEESITYNIIKNNTKNTIITYPCNNNYMSIEILSSNSNIIPKNNKINININLTGTINETNCPIISNNKLEKNISNYLNKELTNNINNIRNTYNSDVFGFLDEIYKHNYKLYKKINNTWYKDKYKNIKIIINTKIKLISNGNITEVNNEKN